MIVAWDGNGAVDEGADESPDKAGNSLRVFCQELQTKGQAVDIGAVVGNNAEREDNKAELAEATQGGKQHCCEKATNTRVVVAIGVGCIVYGCGCNGETEHFRESEGDYKASPCPGEGFDAADVHWLIDRVVGCIARPTSCKAKYACSEGQDASSF